MSDFENHPPNLRRIGAHHYLVEPSEPQAPDYLLLLLRETYSTLEQLDLHWLIVSVVGIHAFTSARPPPEISRASGPLHQHSSTASVRQLWL